jgi:peptide/nickel transport system substrate-binding protein
VRFGAILLVVGGLAIAASLGYWASGVGAGFDLEVPALDPSRARPQGGVFVGTITDPAHLNPFTSSDGAARNLILRYTHDTLLDRDPATGELREAAAKVTLAGDALALEVQLRDALVFADGRPVTTDDLAFTCSAARSVGLPLGTLQDCFSRIAGFERIDARSCRLRLARLDPNNLNVVGTEFPILQAEFWQRAVREACRAAGESEPELGSSAFAAALARVALPGPGTGAYVLGTDRRTGAPAWRRGVELALVHNPRSWRRAVYPQVHNLAGIRYRILPDPAARVAELRAGRIDWYFDDDAEDLWKRDAAVQARCQLLKYSTSRLGHHMVIWNTRRPLLRQARVRQALGMLFDRQAIVAKHLHGNGVPAAAWFRPGQPEYPTDLTPLPLDIAGAKQVLATAGIGPDAQVSLSILVADFSPLHRRILEEALPAFAAAGIQLEILRRELGEVQERLERRDFDGVLYTWYHTPWIDPYAEFHSSQVEAPGLNYSGLADPEIDAVLEQARAAIDPAARAALYRRFGHLLHGAAPVALLVHPRLALLVSRRFEGVVPGALGVVFDDLWVRP